MYIWWYRFTISSLGFSIFGTVIGSPTETEQNTQWQPSYPFCASFTMLLVVISTAPSLTYGRDRLAVRHDSPGVSKEEATSMKKARGKAQDLLKPFLQASPVAALFKDHLLVGVILSERIHWNQVRPDESWQGNPSMSQKNEKALLIINKFCFVYLINAAFVIFPHGQSWFHLAV